MPASNETDLKNRIAQLSDAELRREIAALFNDWCAVSTDPMVKQYYGWLLEESDCRRERAAVNPPHGRPPS